jgi:hypothetical protein
MPIQCAYRAAFRITGLTLARAAADSAGGDPEVI